MTITYDFDLEDTAQFQRPVGEETRLLGIQDTPTIPRRPAAAPASAERNSFGLAGGSTSEQPIIIYFPEYAAKHRAPEMPPAITPVAPAESVPPFRPSLMRRLFARLGRVGG